MANAFDQFDEAGGSNAFDQFDQKPEAPAQENVARPRLSIPGEFLGGLKDALQGVVNPDAGRPEGMRGGFLQNIPDPGQIVMGLIRSAGSPLAPLTNLSSKAGEVVTDATGSPVAGALTSAAGDVLLPAGISKIVKNANAMTRPFLSTSGEKVADLKSALRVGENSINASAQATRDATIAQAAEETARAQKIQAAQLAQAKEVAASARAPLAGAQDAASTIASAAPTAETVGKKFLTETYPQKLSASKERFNIEYGNLAEQGSSIESDVANLKDSIKSVLGEEGAVKALGKKAEKAAAATKASLPLEEDELYQAARDKLMANGGYDPAALGKQGQKLLEESVAELRSTQAPNPTLSDLVSDRQRIRAEMRAAYSTKNDSLGRQYGKLEKGILADIEAGDAGIADTLRATDSAYKAEHVPYFSKGSATRSLSDTKVENAGSVLDQILRPSSDKRSVEKVTRAFDLMEPAERQSVREAWMKSAVGEAPDPKKIVAKWDKLSNPDTENKVLKTLFGDSYDHTKGLVDTMRSVKPKAIDTALGEAVDAINKKASNRLSSIDKVKAQRLGTLEGALSEGDMLKTGQVGTIEKNRSAQIADLQKSVEKQIKEVGGSKINLRGLKFWGLFLIGHGAATVNPVRVGEGFAVLIGGKTIEKLMSNKTGSDLLRKGLRASMTSTEAQAIARQIQNVVQGVESGNTE